MSDWTLAGDWPTELVAAVAALALAVAGVAVVAGWQVARGTVVGAAVMAWLALGVTQGVEPTRAGGGTGGPSV
jgi:hypothetical protein